MKTRATCACAENTVNPSRERSSSVLGTTWDALTASRPAGAAWERLLKQRTSGARWARFEVNSVVTSVDSETDLCGINYPTRWATYMELTLKTKGQDRGDGGTVVRDPFLTPGCSWNSGGNVSVVITFSYIQNFFTSVSVVAHLVCSSSELFCKWRMWET